MPPPANKPGYTYHESRVVFDEHPGKVTVSKIKIDERIEQM